MNGAVTRKRLLFTNRHSTDINERRWRHKFPITIAIKIYLAYILSTSKLTDTENLIFVVFHRIVFVSVFFLLAFFIQCK